MTADELARSYISRAGKRMSALRALMGEEAFPDVVREAQELVELALKGMLRAVGIDPPKWHDVGKILVEQGARFPVPLQAELSRLAEISARLRKDREISFYGDIDFIPEENFRHEDAARALADAEWVLSRAEALLRF